MRAILTSCQPDSVQWAMVVLALVVAPLGQAARATTAALSVGILLLSNYVVVHSPWVAAQERRTAASPRVDPGDGTETT
jgi:hypothetical protein